MLSSVSLLLLLPAIYSPSPVFGAAGERRSLDAQGLFPFPRIGRANIAYSWPYEKYRDYLTRNQEALVKQIEGRMQDKVGRYNKPSCFDSRLEGNRQIKEDSEKNKRSDQPQTMWFGPRLGKRTHNVKTQYGAEAQSNDLNLKRIFGLIPTGRTGRSAGNGPKRNGATPGGGLWFGPRLGKRDPEVAELYFQGSSPRDFDQELVSIFKDMLREQKPGTDII